MADLKFKNAARLRDHLRRAAVHVGPTASTSENTFWCRLFPHFVPRHQRGLCCRPAKPPEGDFHIIVVILLFFFFLTLNKISFNYPRTRAMKCYLSAANCNGFKVPSKRRVFFSFFFVCFSVRLLVVGVLRLRCPKALLVFS